MSRETSPRLLLSSDLHVDYPENRAWLEKLSTGEYQDDILVLAGDISHSRDKLCRVFSALASRFRKVLFVPGNHDLWMAPGEPGDSFQKCDHVLALAEAHGVCTGVLHCGAFALVPLLAWYDFTFAQQTIGSTVCWLDLLRCRWPENADCMEVTSRFLQRNEARFGSCQHKVITCSHFLPRLDLFPWELPPHAQQLFPFLGTWRLDQQLRRLGAIGHLYGHSHVNANCLREGVWYLNNALGYPHERAIARRALVEVLPEQGLGKILEDFRPGYQGI